MNDELGEPRLERWVEDEPFILRKWTELNDSAFGGLSA